MFHRLRNIGPGAVVAAAFIGPGTVTTATFAGSSYGFTLLWAVLFSVLVTLLLQEMASRLGTLGRLGLGEAIRQKISNPNLKWIISVLVLAAIFIGNAAYEAGNLSGAALGLPPLPIMTKLNLWVVVIGFAAFLLLWQGRYKLIERSLILLVAVMGLIFFITALCLSPNLVEIFKGMFYPAIPKGSMVMVIGLIGTTVVPYNLFLHASAAKTNWSANNYSEARIDTVISVLGGGVITMSVLVTAALSTSNASGEINSINDFALQLHPLLGSWSEGFISVGFLTAGLSSAITAPLAAAYATTEVLGWSSSMKSFRFRVLWILVLLCGIVLSSLGLKPTLVILFAQFTNGLLLPILAGVLLWVMNDPKIMGDHINSRWLNLFGILAIAITMMLSIKSIAGVIGTFG